MTGITQRIRLVEIEKRENEQWLHLWIPLSANVKRIILIVLGVVGIGMILRMQLIDPETAKALIRFLTTGSP